MVPDPGQTGQSATFSRKSAERPPTIFLGELLVGPDFAADELEEVDWDADPTDPTNTAASQRTQPNASSTDNRVNTQGTPQTKAPTAVAGGQGGFLAVAKQAEGALASGAPHPSGVHPNSLGGHRSQSAPRVNPKTGSLAKAAVPQPKVSPAGARVGQGPPALGSDFPPLGQQPTPKSPPPKSAQPHTTSKSPPLQPANPKGSQPSLVPKSPPPSAESTFNLPPLLVPIADGRNIGGKRKSDESSEHSETKRSHYSSHQSEHDQNWWTSQGWNQWSSWEPRQRWSRNTQQPCKVEKKKWEGPPTRHRDWSIVKEWTHDYYPPPFETLKFSELLDITFRWTPVGKTSQDVRAIIDPQVNCVKPWNVRNPEDLDTAKKIKGAYVREICYGQLLEKISCPMPQQWHDALDQQFPSALWDTVEWVMQDNSFCVNKKRGGATAPWRDLVKEEAQNKHPSHRRHWCVDWLQGAGCKYCMAADPHVDPDHGDHPFFIIHRRPLGGKLCLVAMDMISLNTCTAPCYNANCAKINHIHQNRRHDASNVLKYPEPTSTETSTLAVKDSWHRVVDLVQRLHTEWQSEESRMVWDVTMSLLAPTDVRTLWSNTMGVRSAIGRAQLYIHRKNNACALLSRPEVALETLTSNIDEILQARLP